MPPALRWFLFSTLIVCFLWIILLLFTTSFMLFLCMVGLFIFYTCSMKVFLNGFMDSLTFYLVWILFLAVNLLFPFLTCRVYSWLCTCACSCYISGEDDYELLLLICLLLLCKKSFFGITRAVSGSSHFISFAWIVWRRFFSIT